MNFTHFSFFYLYTFPLFLSISYLVYLRFFYFVKYADHVTRVTSNLSTCLLILYLGSFALSLAISITFHSASLTSEAFAWYVANQLDLEKLKAIAVKGDCPEAGKFIILDKERIDTIDDPQGETGIPTATIKGETPKDINNHSTDKQGPY